MRPSYLLLKGPMGIGKTATAQKLGKQLAWPVIDKDDASDVLIGKLEPHGKYAYEIMFAYAESLLSQGFSVIVDSPMRSDISYKKAASFAEEHGVELKVLELYCSDQSVWADRLEKRNRRKAHVIKNWQDFEAYWQKAEDDFSYPIKHSLLKIDTLNPIEENIRQVSDWLNKT